MRAEEYHACIDRHSVGRSNGVRGVHFLIDRGQRCTMASSGVAVGPFLRASDEHAFVIGSTQLVHSETFKDLVSAGSETRSLESNTHEC